MRYLHTIFIILFFALSAFFSFGISETYANNYITQVNVDSSSVKVKKLQEVFKWLWLYSGEIDWNFYSIREALVDYQVENWIVPDREHEEAGYFWNKTIKSLKNKYWQDFLDLQKEFLTLDTPQINQEWYFIVTAYYTPVPGQKRYSTWSYEAEKKLNGWWNTASWKAPIAWTIAAPRNYNFWTKIFLEWYWVWEVHDRWGAIVNSGDRWHLHDRLDLWMWYGDEWRERTKAWWVKTIKWTIVDNSTPINVNFSVTPLDSIVAETKESNKEMSNENSLEFYRDLYVSPENPNSDDVKLLQKLLIKTKNYSWEINWDYNSVKDILINFQVENNVITSANSREAWYFWKKTLDVFFRKYWNNLVVSNEEKTETKKEVVSIKEENKSSFILSNEEKNKILKVRDSLLNQLKNKYSWEEYYLNLTEIKGKLQDTIKKTTWEYFKSTIEFLVENL